VVLYLSTAAEEELKLSVEKVQVEDYEDWNSMSNFWENLCHD
jgi:hypothetical protein